MKIAAVVMAGGCRERFWPLSKKSLPKQFLSILGHSSMLKQTVDRLEGLVCPEDIYIVTLNEYKAIVLDQIPWICEDNILVEPCGRDTAAAVGLAAVEIARRFPGAVMVMLPSDHFISDTENFIVTLKATAEAASKGDQAVTLGIPPLSPETGYGYILKGDFYREFNGLKAHKAVKFTEKPAHEKAVEYVNSGNYFWNSGIFIWRVDLIRRLISIHLPELEEGLKAIQSAPDDTKK